MGALTSQILSIVFFLYVMYGLGAGVKALFKIKNENIFVELCTRFVLGFGVFVLVAFVLDTIRVPLYWIIFFVLAGAGIWHSMSVDEKTKSRFKLKDVDWYILVVLVMCFVLAYVMIGGAHVYAYLENDDPWAHATGTLFVAKEKTYQQTPGDIFAHYLAPYPPFYDALMGVIAQISFNVPWTLKFYNGLLVGLMLLPAYLFFWRFSKNKLGATIMAGMLLVLPSFASHFIWAQTYALFLLFVALYTITLAIEDKRWFWPSILMVTACLVTQPSATFMNGLFIFTLWLAYLLHAFLNGKNVLNVATKRLFAIGAIGLGIAICIFGYFIAIYGNEFMTTIGFNLDFSEGGQGFGIGDTSGGVTYTFKDFWVAPKSSKIDQATGIGQVITLLALLGALLFILKFKQLKKKEWIVTAMVWLALSVVYINGNRFPHQLLFVHRYWPWLSIAVAMVATITVIMVLNGAKDNWLKAGIIATLAILIIVTSWSAKYAVQTANWPPGAHWTSVEEINGYTQMKQQIPVNSRVFPLCKHDDVVIGMGMHSEPWKKEIRTFRESIANVTGQEILVFLQQHQYRYITVDSTCLTKYNANETQNILNKITATGRFSPTIQINGFVLLELR